jgi:hypothetical protein
MQNSRAPVICTGFHAPPLARRQWLLFTSKQIVLSQSLNIAINVAVTVHLSPILVTAPVYLILLDLITRITFDEKCIFVSKFLIMQLFAVPCYLLPLGPKYLPQHPIEHLHPSTSLSVTDCIQQ